MTGRWSPVQLMVFIYTLRTQKNGLNFLVASGTLLHAVQAEIQAIDSAPVVHASILVSKRQTRNNFCKLAKPACQNLYP